MRNSRYRNIATLLSKANFAALEKIIFFTWQVVWKSWHGVRKENKI